ncbi:MAG: GtrA family protein [Oscillospiraceae bacterium]|nr:GtrA family protein [Oscillospiraceae bacterium]
MKRLWRTYGQLFKYALASATSFGLDSGLFYLFKRFVFGSLGAWADLACTIAARAISSFYNFNVNNRLVFGHRGEYGKALLRYYLLALPIMLGSATLVTLVNRLLGVSAPGPSTAVKIAVDTVLFLASYFIQKKWVFRQKEERDKEERASQD